MTSLSDYKSKTKRAYFLIGPPGVGKTTLAVNFPKPYILELDNNLAGPAEYLTRLGFDLKHVQFDIPHIKADGSIVPRAQRWVTLLDLVARAMVNPEIETIVIDGLTELTQYAEDEVRRQNSWAIGDFTIPDPNAKTIPKNADKPLEIQGWGAFAALLKHFLVQVKSSGKRLVLTAHMTTDKDDMVGTLRYFVKCPGQTREVLAGYFDEVWLLNKVENKDKTAAEVNVTLIPESKSFSQLGLKTSTDLKNNFTLDLKNIQKHLSV
jgi:hypothetical protein